MSQTTQPGEIAQRFAEDGYFVARRLFDPVGDLQSLKDAHSKLLDALAYVYMSETATDALESYDAAPFTERFAILLGCSDGCALHHLDPALTVYRDSFKYRRDLPSAHIPELFYLMRHVSLIDIVEQLIGPEITASPLYHLNFKLAKQHLAAADALAKSVDRQDTAISGSYGFYVGKTGWHTDAHGGLRDSHSSQIVNAWVPLTAATVDNGCLMVVPGSHLEGVRPSPPEEELIGNAVTLAVDPGDVVLLHNKVLPASTANTTADDYRWTFNFRYLPTGQPCGRPSLPAFVARSRRAPESELRNPFVWSTMWDRALTCCSENGVPLSLKEGLKMKPAKAAKFTRRWERLAPNEYGWLRLNRCPS